MPEQLKNVIIFMLVIFVLVILWAISIGITYWDAASRRKLPGLETIAWIALVVLVPGIGFAAYLFARWLARSLTPKQPLVETPRRVTMIQYPPAVERRTGTIAAADYLRPYTSATIAIPINATEAEKPRWKFKISIIAGPNSGEEYILESFPVKIGRGMDVSIRLDEDHNVSRLHAEFYEQTGVLNIRDLKSTHGSKVNGFPIKDRSLAPGDRIQVGQSILLVTILEVEG